MWLNMSKGTCCRKTRFWITEYIDKRIKILSPGRFLRFHIFWNLQYLLSCSLDLMYANTLLRFPNFQSPFLKINFSPIYYDVIIELTISRECNVRFIFFLFIYYFLHVHQNWSERTIIEEIQKVKFWSSDPTGPFRCVESHVF